MRIELETSIWCIHASIDQYAHSQLNHNESVCQCPPANDAIRPVYQERVEGDQICCQLNGSQGGEEVVFGPVPICMDVYASCKLTWKESEIEGESEGRMAIPGQRISAQSEPGLCTFPEWRQPSAPPSIILSGQQARLPELVH
ncbi:unnamed protein product [Protopolystoma xenopodis]|uniref:Uncharacterized protein n=1 Tax=Protopolystoma xenopodis TaxID=117903 RepID=A0A448XJI8_9PLAT|nr:unnamed protein product [Protopolystoma xenopodis]